MLQKDIERFEIFGVDGKWLIKDNEQLPNLLDCYQSCVRLNEFTKRITELEEQLKNCIKPKFKIGQEVWSIFQSQYFRDCKELCNLEITAIMKTNKGIFYQGYVLEQGKNRSDYWFDENNTFLNKEEAEAKLKELQGD